jgi:phosphoribosylamine-glycine ligase
VAGVVDAFRAAGLNIFGPTQAAFQLSGCLGRAKNVQAGSAKRIDHARHQWRFRADDGQIDGFRRP